MVILNSPAAPNAASLSQPDESLRALPTMPITVSIPSVVGHRPHFDTRLLASFHAIHRDCSRASPETQPATHRPVTIFPTVSPRT
jgi:hypothetical protein